MTYVVFGFASTYTSPGGACYYAALHLGLLGKEPCAYARFVDSPSSTEQAGAFHTENHPTT